MTDIQSAVVLGIVEGLTEFLPVSSTGHLIIFGHLIEFTGPRADSFEIFIQLGAILAVVVLYFRRFLGLLKIDQGLKISPASFTGASGLLKLFLACLPAFILGAALHHVIKEKLFGSVPVAAALIIGGLIMLWVERLRLNVRTEQLDQISFAQSLKVGLFQCAALWPGVSRSAATIIGGMIVGLRRDIAAEFSFLVAVPVMVAATAYDALKSWSGLTAADVPVFTIGFIVSFFTALAAVRLFIAVIKRFSLTPFAIYRILLGAGVLASVYLRSA